MTTIVQKGQYVIRKGQEIVAKRDAKHKAEEDLMNVEPGVYLLESPLFEYKVSGAIAPPPAPEPPAPPPAPEPPSPPPPPLPTGSKALSVVMHHDGEGVQAAGFVSPMFGSMFEQGAIPAGTYPQYRTASGQVCPATLWDIASWPDGSMRKCGGVVQVPVAFNGVGAHEISAFSGGAAPARGPRSTDDLLAADMEIEMVGVDGLEGTWVASLNDAIDTGHVVLRGSGAAGTFWVISGEVSDSKGAPHGQLYVAHYVLALSNMDGSFRGMLYLGRVMQPWADVTVPPARHRDMRVTLKSAGAVIRVLRGHTTSETPGDVVRLQHYASFFTAGEDGEYDYIQGSGSEPKKAAVRVTHSVPELIDTQQFPPYDESTVINAAPPMNYVPGCKGAARRDMPGTGDADDIGLLTRWGVQYFLRQDAGWERVNRVTALAGGGWRNCVKQRATRQVPVVVAMDKSYAGLAAKTGWRWPSHTTGGIVNPSPNASLWQEGGDLAIGHQPAAFYPIGMKTGEPQYVDMQMELANSRMLDMHPGPGPMTFSTVEPITLQSMSPNSLGRDVRIITAAGPGVRRPAAGLAFDTGNGRRKAAWALRDVAHAAAMAADVPADGVEIRALMKDAVINSLLAVLDYRDGSTPQRSADGMFAIKLGYSDGDWMFAYFNDVIRHIADILPSAEAEEVCDYLSRYWVALQEKQTILLATNYRTTWCDGPAIVKSAADINFLREVGAISFTAKDSRGIFVAGTSGLSFNGSRLWTLQNGDTLTFGVSRDGVSGQPKPFPNIGNGRVLYTVNVQGLSFQLSETPGGPPLTVPADITISVPHWASGAKIEPVAALSDSGLAASYWAIVRGTLAYLVARGNEAARPAYETLDGVLKKWGCNWTNQPKYRIAADEKRVR